jgi:hypothetical protein
MDLSTADRFRPHVCCRDREGAGFSGQHEIASSGYCPRKLLRFKIIVVSRLRLARFPALAVLFFGLQAASSLSGQSPKTDDHPILVELFTSEGCSSCPPADAVLEKMDTLQPVAGAQLIVLSEHVDYWDHDGWKDPNSSSALSERQTAYCRALGLTSRYTPQFIVDGAIEMHADNPQQVNQVLRDANVAPQVPVRIGEVIVDAGNPAVLRTLIAADGNSSEHNADVYVVVALNRVESQVLHGENGGRRLTHVAVVQQLTKIGKLQKGKSFEQTVQLKLKPGTDPKNVRIVALVQEPGSGKLLGAALRKPAG